MAAGSDVIMDQDGLEKTFVILCDYFAPEAAGSVYQEAVWFPQFKRTDQTMDEYLVQADSLRRTAESKRQV